LPATQGHEQISERSYLFTMSDIPHPRGAWAATRRMRKTFLCERARARSGGARRDRTDDLLLAKQALSQLSYGPSRLQASEVSDQEIARRGGVLTTDA
jgi:hypothetical protein